MIPSNENRGYVLRRIIRRAIRHGNMLGAKDTFFWKLVAPLIDVMGSAGDELKQQQAQVEQVLKTEEEQFARTLERGPALLDEELSKLKGDTGRRNRLPSVRHLRLPGRPDRRCVPRAQHQG
ncbi:hypothetical protein KPZU09_77010 [Klebsiella pneumoniae]|uniref:Alanine--tRNA ligase n=1 Tax=Klebsiella pneumoniae TaxID=573 RepID=A0A919I1D2_KLEPN|nr:hypothetical protein KPZU09_77010 [Klebsiella pneumoniae]